jgi:hypothetical protein
MNSTQLLNQKTYLTVILCGIIVGFVIAPVAFAHAKVKQITHVKVEGTITLGPTCGGAVIFPNPEPTNCDDRPYKTTVYFIKTDETVHIAATSSENGHYKVMLPAGTYVVRDRVTDSADPILVPFYYPYLTTVGPVSIGGEKRVELDLSFDTGLR